MTDRRPENPKLRLRMVGIEESTEHGEYRWQKIDREPSADEIVAAVRRGVESGTIKGEAGWWCLTHRNGVVQTGTFPPDSCWSFNADAGSCLLVDATVVIGSVSDGGSET